MNEAAQEIDRIRREYGPRLLILGHHYQRQSLLRHVDVIGDSLELSRKASHSDAARVVFCGVRFMAESADILTSASQTVYMPVTSAGCPMADMADAADVQAAWGTLQARGNDWLPVVYVNSSAEIKALCGRWGGSACTSSNAARVLRRAFDQGKRVFFLPDEHLGRNTAHDLGLPADAVALYDQRREGGGISDETLGLSKMVVWKGFCLVHTAFTVEQVRQVREHIPGARIIVHPETPMDIVALADAHGSTSQIIRYVEEAPAGSTVVIGTEVNLIDRLAEAHKGRLTIKALKPSVCANMAKTNVHNLLDLLQRWPEDCRIRVPADVAADARIALERMLAT